MSNSRLCGAEHPDWPLACCREPHRDATHEGYGEIWKDTLAVTDDDRAGFWMGWTRQTIAWFFGLVCAVIVFMVAPLGWPSTVALAVVAVAAVAMAKLAWIAVSFAVGNQRTSG